MKTYVHACWSTWHDFNEYTWTWIDHTSSYPTFWQPAIGCGSTHIGRPRPITLARLVLSCRNAGDLDLKWSLMWSHQTWDGTSRTVHGKPTSAWHKWGPAMCWIIYYKHPRINAVGRWNWIFRVELGTIKKLDVYGSSNYVHPGAYMYISGYLGEHAQSRAFISSDHANTIRLHWHMK